MYCALAASEAVWVGVTFKDVGRVLVHLDPVHAVLDFQRLLPVLVHTFGHDASAELLVPVVVQQSGVCPLRANAYR